jgi:hypothetical protein
MFSYIAGCCMKNCQFSLYYDLGQRSKIISAF